MIFTHRVVVAYGGRWCLLTRLLLHMVAYYVYSPVCFAIGGRWCLLTRLLLHIVTNDMYSPGCCIWRQMMFILTRLLLPIVTEDVYSPGCCCIRWQQGMWCCLSYLRTQLWWKDSHNIWWKRKLWLGQVTPKEPIPKAPKTLWNTTHNVLQCYFIIFLWHSFILITPHWSEIHIHVV